MGISPTAAQSSPEQIGILLNDPKLARAGAEASAYNTAPPQIQQQIDAAKEQAAQGAAPSGGTGTSTGSQLTTADGRPLLAGTSSIGWLNWLSQNPVTADQLLLPQDQTKDPKLAQISSFKSPLTGVRRTDAQVSLFNDPNAPRSILEEVQSLNTNQSLRRAAQSEYLDTLFRNATSNPAYAEALRAASVQPGASVGFGSRILSGAEMGANVTGATSAARNIDARTKAIQQVDNRQRELQSLQQQRTQAGQNPMGFYTGSVQEKLDRQIMALQDDIRNNKSTQNVAMAAAGTSSGWVPIR